MTETTRRPSQPGSIQQVSLRRGRKQWSQVPTRILIAAIRRGKLKPDDEYSVNGTHWSRLGAHPQLSRLFPGNAEAETAKPPAPQVEAQLDELARLMRDINQ